MNKVTASDVARACGVSQATVSYVLNNRADKNISERTREKILRTAREMCYYPDISARNMRTQRAMSIGIVLNQDMITLSFTQVLSGVKEVLYKNGYSITLLPNDDPGPEASYLVNYLSRRVDGLLFFYTTLEESTLKLLEQHKIPYLVINEMGIGGCGGSISTGLESVIHECVLFCREHGYGRAAYISFYRNTDNPTATQKFRLLRDCFALEYPSAVLDECPIERGEDAVVLQKIEAVLAKGPQIVFTALPRLTMLTQNAIMRRHLGVPQAIPHISLYDSRFFDLLYPSVTHLEFSLTDMGAYACQRLIAYLSGKELPDASFSCSLHRGMSTLAP